MSALRQALHKAASAVEVMPETSGWQRRYLFEASSAVFAGHFPGHPVLPGVAQILMAQMTLEDAMGRPIIISSINQAKFMAPVEPEAVIELQVKMGGAARLWDCMLYHDKHMVARFQLEII